MPEAQWLERDAGHGDTVECTACGAVFDAVALMACTMHPTSQYPVYCPACGQRMRIDKKVLPDFCIERDGITYTLTDDELIQAYFTQSERFDYEEIESELDEMVKDKTPKQILEQYGRSETMLRAMIPQIAEAYRDRRDSDSAYLEAIYQCRVAAVEEVLGA